MTTDKDRLFCPRCGDPLEVDEEWLLIKPWKQGTRIGQEGIQGDYVHDRCANAIDYIALFELIEANE